MHRLQTPLQIKQLNKGEFQGYGSIFGNVDLGGDVVMPGAFKSTLKEFQDKGALPVMLYGHDANQIPGKWTSMSEDSNGLAVKGELAPTSLGNDVHTLLKMGAINGLSIGYMPNDFSFDKNGVRMLHDVKLFEISVVSIPMNPEATISAVKSLLHNDEGSLAELKRDCERHFMKQGLNKRSAMERISKFFNDLPSEMDGDDTPDASVTPELMELRAGASSLEDKLLLIDLQKITRRFVS